LVGPAVVAVALLVAPLYATPYWIHELSLIAVFTLVVSGVNLSFGYAGEVQFGQVFMFALGAYVTMALATHGFNEIIVLMAIGGLAAGLVGFAIALPAMRIGGWSLAMASFFLVITIPDLTAIFVKYTGGYNGLIGIPAPSLFGVAVSDNGLYEVALVAALLWLACLRNLVTSRYGVTFRALRESPVLAQSLGFAPLRLKVLAYTLGAVPAGIAGCIYGYVSLILVPSDFGISLAVGIVAASVLGGVESVYGAAAGAAIMQLGPEKSLSFATYAPVAYGVFLIVAAVGLRQGLGGVGKMAALRLSRRLSGGVKPSVSTAAHLRALHGATNLDVGAAAARGGISGLRGARLEVRGVSKAYGGVQALDNVSLIARPGEVTGLIGSNGSGKTTLLNAICGFTRADEGAITFGEDDLGGLAPHRIAIAGVGRTFQTPSVPRGVSVIDAVASGRFAAEHVGPAAAILRLARYRRASRLDRAEAIALLELVGLADVADQPAASLPLGMRRLLELARALCSKPRLLLLDEPASGLSDEEVHRLGQLIAAAAGAGATVILIEHNFRFVTSISDIIHVLHLGKVLASGPAAAISEDPHVIESYLGETTNEPVSPVSRNRRELQRGAAATAGQADGSLLELTDVESGYGDLRVLQGVSLSVRSGDVEVVLGRNGVGKTTLLSTISGQLPLWRGTITLRGERIDSRPTYRRAKSGIALVQEGKRIFRNRTIWENMMLGTISLRLNSVERRELCDSLLEQFPILKERAHERASGLSGGQQQMLAVAQALASRPQVLLLDEPSAGLAPAIVAEVFERLRNLANNGLAVILVEQLADQALRIADHVTVLENGCITASGPPDAFHNLSDLQEAYFGTPSGTSAPNPYEPSLK
jgi:branched-chain amino acid transport system permease protein